MNGTQTAKFKPSAAIMKLDKSWWPGQSNEKSRGEGKWQARCHHGLRCTGDGGDIPMLWDAFASSRLHDLPRGRSAICATPEHLVQEGDVQLTSAPRHLPLRVFEASPHSRTAVQHIPRCDTFIE